MAPTITAIRLWRGLLLALTLWVSAPGAAPADAVDTRQQVLVFFNMPPVHFHTNSGYGDAQGNPARRRIAAGLAREQGLTVAAGWPMPVIGVDCYVMNVPPGRAAREVAALLSRDRRVAWAEPNAVFHAPAELASLR